MLLRRGPGQVEAALLRELGPLKQVPQERLWLLEREEQRRFASLRGVR